MAESKPQLRARLLKARLSLSEATCRELSLRVCQHLSAWINQQPFQSIFLYLSHKSEPDVSALIKTLDPKRYAFALPIVLKERGAMEFHQWRSSDGMILNRYGIQEPKLDEDARKVEPNDKTLILIPSVALAKNGTRLGYGGGYFDRFLSTQAKGASLLGVCFEDFLMPELPRESQDVLVEWIATEAGVSPVSA